MTMFEPALLNDRALIAVTGPDAISFLDNIVTTAVDALVPGEARFAAVLSPQGKILFEFFVVRTENGVLLDTLTRASVELIKRLKMYRLRAKVIIDEVSGSVAVSPTQSAGSYQDPRDARLGFRCVDAFACLKVSQAESYHANRIALGIPEGGRDYPLGDTFPHEANLDLLGGVSFTKGCYVGQEVVARMHNKTVVRKRVIKISGSANLTEGAAILIGDVEIGRVGSVHGQQGLALLRLDRAAEAETKAQVLMAAGVAIRADTDALQRYTKSLAERPVIDL